MDIVNGVDLSGFRRLYPYQSNFFETNGLKYHYIDQGEGLPVVMVHGNPTWSFYYRSLINEFSKSYRTIVPDHIGCGLSDKPGESEYEFTLARRAADFEAFLDHLDFNQPLTMIVHDWGGSIGLAYAVKYPEKIGRIVILNTAAFLKPETKKIPILLSIVRRPGGFSSFLVQSLNLFVMGATYLGVSKKMSKEVRAGLTAPYNNAPNRLAVLKFVQDIPLFEDDASYDTVKELGENLQKLKDIPMLICWGMKDFVFDRDYYYEFRQRFPNAHVHEFPSAGHYILEDEPQGIINAVNGFFEKHRL